MNQLVRRPSTGKFGITLEHCPQPSGCPYFCRDLHLSILDASSAPGESNDVTVDVAGTVPSIKYNIVEKHARAVDSRPENMPTLVDPQATEGMSGNVESIVAFGDHRSV